MRDDHPMFGFGKPVKAIWSFDDPEDGPFHREIWLVGWLLTHKELCYISLWEDYIPSDQIKGFL